MDKQLSLIILTYNSEKDIYECLHSVYQYNDIGDSLEVIVVDNNSDNWNMTEQIITMKYPQVVTISNHTNGGYGQGNNIGIKAASAPIIAIMNPDVRLIMPVFNTFVKTLTISNVAMCGGKQFCTVKEPARSFNFDFMIPAFIQAFFSPICKRCNIFIHKIMWLEGAFFAIRKDTFEEIGLFDENLFMYCEENDIMRRLHIHFPNSKTAYLPDIKYLHITQNRPFSKKAVVQQIKSQLYLCKKFGVSCYKFKRNELKLIMYQHILSIIKTRTNVRSTYQEIRKELLSTL